MLTRWGHLVDQVSGGTMSPQQQLITRPEQEFAEQEFPGQEFPEREIPGAENHERRETPPRLPDRTGGARRPGGTRPPRPHRKAWYVAGACAVVLAAGTMRAGLAWSGESGAGSACA